MPLVKETIIGTLLTRAPLAAALLLAAGGPAIARSADLPPSTPAGLATNAYSGTAGAVSWRPSTDDRGAVSGYEVTRDGRVLGTLDALSYIDFDLAAGTTYTYGVTAIDQAGQRSDTATVRLTTTGASGSGGGGNASALAAPAGLRADVYSGTAAEITWTRPPTFGLTYEITRDGTRVGTIDGISYYDDSLSGGTAYTYQVIAIDREGRRSAPSTVIVRTEGSGGSGTPRTPPAPVTPTAPAGPSDTAVASWGPTTSTRDLTVPPGLHERDGYGDIDVVRFDVETVTSPGTCTIDDQSGCTLEDVIADVDPYDDFKVDIPVHFMAPDFPDDGLEVNAGMRQRGATSRQASQKSFRVKFEGKGIKWRDEDKLQINKHPFDPSKIRNKLAFDLMARIPSFPSSNTQFVNLWIDDGEGPVDYGVFTHTEASAEEYFEQRGWDEDGKFYKAEKFLFAPEDLRFMALDEEGEPEDEDAFETRLEIQYEGDDDHRVLIEMVRAINDPGRDFDDVLDAYFDRDNLVTWVTVNILLRQLDAVTHNWYLYNPGGTEKFYILPWDYDQTFGVEPEPENSFETEALARRLFYGFGKGRASNLLRKLYERPGFYDAVLAKAETLVNGPFAEGTVDALATRYAAVVEPVALRGPDRYKYKPEQHLTFARDIGRTHDELRGGYLPFPPYLFEPRIEDGTVEFRWSDAYDVTGRRTLTYDLEVATSPGFRREDRLLLETRIPDGGERLSFEVPLERLGSGTRYVRLVVRADEDPSTIWQIASNRETLGGEPRIGVREFRVP